VPVTRVYAVLLRLYPSDYQVLFADEMASAFAEAAADHHARGPVVFARFVVGESLGVTTSLPSEWFAKWTSDRSIRGRYMPDRRTMRPPGVSKRDHYG
jgi:hypothetical protein